MQRWCARRVQGVGASLAAVISGFLCQLALISFLEHRVVGMEHPIAILPGDLEWRGTARSIKWCDFISGNPLSM
jgi:hypothetical protein